MSKQYDNNNRGHGRSGKGGSRKRSRSKSDSSSSGKSGSSGRSSGYGKSGKSSGYGKSGESGRSDGSKGSSGRSYGSDDRRSSKGAHKAEWEGHQTKRRRDLQGAAVDLPNWIVEALVRVTPKDRIAPALEALGEASAAMNDGRYHAAVKDAKRAKNLSPQDSTIRETLGLSAYRIGDWKTP